MKFENSIKLLNKAKNIIPAQAQTFSKNWTQYPLGQSPIFASKADGGYIWDVDGNKFIDWPMALGPILLGHNNEMVNKAIIKRLEEGIAFSLPHSKEISVAEQLIDLLPYAEAVRFGKNGSDVTSAAVRAARAYTNKDHILCCGYHGWQDWFVGTTTRSRGVPKNVSELTHKFEYNNINSLEKLLDRYNDNVAAIIMEPLGVVCPEEGFLESVRELANLNKCVLIFDECWTGFRIHEQGAYGKYKITPDLACFGKALGNGIPISVVLGQKDIMRVFEDIFFSFTFGGDLLGLVAAETVINIIKNEPVIQYLNKIGRDLIDGIDKIIEKNKIQKFIKTSGYPARSILSFDNDGTDGLLLKSIFQQESIKRGVLAAGWHAPCYAHTEKDIIQTLDVYDEVLNIIAKNLKADDLNALLKGSIVKPVFREL